VKGGQDSIQIKNQGMKKIILLYGSLLAALIFSLKFIEYRYFIRDLTLEIYLGIIALLFTAVGIWAGLKITRKKITVISHEGEPFQVNEDLLKQFGISKREYEVLEWMARGLSNQEIADKLFVSLNTIKTHSSNLFIKLDVKRRTQAVQKAKDLRLIP
jgi:two-component system, NarL family, response regulator LiaR